MKRRYLVTNQFIMKTNWFTNFVHSVLIQMLCNTAVILVRMRWTDEMVRGIVGTAAA